MSVRVGGGEQGDKVNRVDLAGFRRDERQSLVGIVSIHLLIDASIIGKNEPTGLCQEEPIIHKKKGKKREGDGDGDGLWEENRYICEWRVGGNSDARTDSAICLHINLIRFRFSKA